MCEFFFLHFMLITKAYRKTLCTTISATSGVLDIPFAHFSYNPGRYIIPYILKFHNFIHEKLYCFYAKSAHYSNEGNGFFIVILFLLLARRVVLYNLIKSHNTQHIISNFRKNFQTFLPSHEHTVFLLAAFIAVQDIVFTKYVSITDKKKAVYDHKK
jgi:exosortase/archaeosortase